MPPTTTTTSQALPPSFRAKKSKILASLSVPTTEYDDLSPKGSIDVGIRSLIDEINSVEGWVTTSSCAGRISVFLEGRKKSQDGSHGVETEKEEAREEDEPETETETETRAGVGGKGGGGRWLFVSHDAVASEELEEREQELARFLGMQRDQEEKASPSTTAPHPRDIRFIHFKFEPMILHILTSSLAQAQLILSAALQAGFRESGALNLTSSSSAEPATPMVGIRSMGLALESLVGYEVDGKEICNVPDAYLKTLMQVSSERFVENTKRIERFRTLLIERRKEGEKASNWEDAGVRRERMREEGLKRSLAKKEETRRSEESGHEHGDEELAFPDQNT